MVTWSNHHESTYGLLRLAFGVGFLFFGIGKFIGGIANFVGGMNQHLAGKLPAAMVMPFAYAIPFCEVVAGGVIGLWFFTPISLSISGVFFIGLSFWGVILGGAPPGPPQLWDALINFLFWVVFGFAGGLVY